MPSSTRAATATRLPDPHAWALTLARGVGETLSGRRPPGALSAYVSREVREVLHRPPLPRQRERQLRTGPLCTHRVHLRRLSLTVVEGNATLVGRDHARAIAFRLEAQRGRWVCTALELGR